MNKRLFFIGSAVVALAVAAGCGGGGSTTSPLPQSATSNQSKAAQGTVTLTIPRPANATSLTKRSPEYIAASTQSFSIQVGSGPQAVTAAAAPACTGTTTLTCTATFTGVVGANVVTVRTFASTDGSGTALSQASTTVTLSAGSNSPVDLTLNAVVAKQVLVVTPASISADGTTQAVGLEDTFQDSTGATIVSGGPLVDSNGNAYPDPVNTPIVSSTPAAGVTIDSASGSYTDWTWTAHVDTSAVTTGTVKFTVGGQFGTNLANASATLTVTATPAPTPTATATASTAPTNVIVNGDFESSSTAIAPWFVCYTGANASKTGNAAYPVTDASPDPAPTAGATAPAATAAPTAGPNANDVRVAQSVPSDASGGTGPVHGGANAVQVGSVDYDLGGSGAGSGNGRGKGIMGVCQTVTVPTTNPQLTFWVYEGGNQLTFSSQNHLAAVFAGDGGFTQITDTPVVGGNAYSTTTTWSDLLFAQNNCFNNYPGGKTGTGTSDQAVCAVGQPTATGGVWYEKGPYDLSAFAGTQVTLMLGVQGNSTSTVIYTYAYYDDVSLTGSSGTTASQKRGAK